MLLIMTLALGLSEQLYKQITPEMIDRMPVKCGPF